MSVYNVMSQKVIFCVNITTGSIKNSNVNFQPEKQLEAPYTLHLEDLTKVVQNYYPIQKCLKVSKSKKKPQ